MNHLRVAFAPYWQSIQHALFPGRVSICSCDPI